MSQGNQMTGTAAEPSSSPGGSVPGAGSLMVVASRLRLGQPGSATPDAWQEGLIRLLDWLRVDAEFVTVPSPTHASPLGERATQSTPLAGTGFTIFAPWLGWSPVALQRGGASGLPQAQFVASYLLDHDRGQAALRGGIDLVLMSPHPSQCVAAQAGDVPLPRMEVLDAMIRAAFAEGREKLAIILHANQRDAMASELRSMDRGLAIELVTIEDALDPLAAQRAPWDAIIAMPDLRGIVFTVLSQASGVKGGWPMLWRGGEGGSAITLVSCETLAGAAPEPALDASVLIHALALCLHHAGSILAARRLHEGWARLRDSGIIVAGRGQDGPYVTLVRDSDFLAMLCDGSAVSRRPVQAWRALGRAGPSAQPTGLRLVASNTAA